MPPTPSTFGMTGKVIKPKTKTADREFLTSEEARLKYFFIKCYIHNTPNDKTERKRFTRNLKRRRKRLFKSIEKLNALEEEEMALEPKALELEREEQTSLTDPFRIFQDSLQSFAKKTWYYTCYTATTPFRSRQYFGFIAIVILGFTNSDAVAVGGG